MLIMTLPNREYGIEAQIVKNNRGYGVRLYDTDAEEFLPMMKIFKILDKAVEYAKKCVR